MTLSRVIKAVTVTGVALAVTLSLSFSAEAQKKARIKMHAAWPSKLAILGTGAVNYAKMVTETSGGLVSLQHFEPGALVPAYQYHDSLEQGGIPAAFGSPGIAVGRNPALAFFSSVPFGPRGGEYIAWMKHGGGNELAQEFYDRWNIKHHLCGLIPPEASGWFRKEIKSLEDLRGLKIRFFGYGGKVLEKFGVSPQFIAGGDIYPALELGTIDATEFSSPVIDEGFGFHQIASHYYFPGWHQQTTLFEFSMHKDTYGKLTKVQKSIIQMACDAMIAITLAEGEATQFGAMKRFQAKGVTLHRWSDETLSRLEAAWSDIIKEEVASNADVAKVYASYSKFRADYKIWADMGYLK